MKKIIIMFLLIICTWLSGCTNQKRDEVNNISSETEQSTTQATKSFRTNQLENTKTNASVTQGDAFKSVKNAVGSISEGYFLRFDRIDTVSNIEYYVFQLYESVVDNQQTGAGHSVTHGWYYVDINSGEVFKMDIVMGKLIEVTELK